MDDLEKLILQAADAILPTLTPDQLRQRLPRRNTPTLQRPPPAWCLAVRANDLRISSWNAILIPEDAADPRDLDHPGRVLPHTVTLDAKLLRQLCQPVRIEPPGQPHDDVARLLGTTPSRLHVARFNNVFRTHY